MTNTHIGGARFRASRKWLRRILLSVTVALLLLGILGNLWINLAARGRNFDHLEELPARRAALVLGCASQVRSGGANLYFLQRIEAAARLYHAGKIEYVIASGDNRHRSYDEPTEMKRALVKASVPAERIYCDYAGFRTLDSVVRAQAIFGQSDFIVVSQRFHTQRALFLARAHGLDAVAYNAADASWTQGPRTLLREQGARAKAFLDVYLFRTEPKFYGPEVPLGPPQLLVNP